MARNKPQQRIPLDWSQLLGFDQLRRDAATPSASVGAKVGVKPQSRIDTKAGMKGGRIRAKVGNKVAPRR